MEKILIGRVTSAVGLKGEVKVYNYSDRTEAYENAPALYVEDSLRPLESLRMQKNMLVIRFGGIESREEAEKLRGCGVFMNAEDLPRLPEGEFYVRELIGMRVEDEDGRTLGTVKNVIQNGPQDLLEVDRTGAGSEEAERDGAEKKERDGAAAGKKACPLLIPKVDAFVRKINGTERVIRVRLPEGLEEL